MMPVKTKQKAGPASAALRWSSIFILSFASALTVCAQTQITGKVLTYDDSSGVQNAVVLLRSAVDSSVLDMTTTDGQGRFSFTVSTGVGPVPVPEGVDIFQNFPNPFSESTTIPFRIDRASNVSVAIYDLLGRQVRTILETKLSPGFHSIQWDGRSNAGLLESVGVYFCTIKSDFTTKTVRIFRAPSSGTSNLLDDAFSRSTTSSQLVTRGALVQQGFLFDVLDSSYSVPRFYSRSLYYSTVVSHSTVAIYVNKIRNDNWHFLGYPDIAPPVIQHICTYYQNKQIHYYKPYVYVLGNGGISRINVLVPGSAWEQIRLQDATGAEYHDHQYLNDFLVFNSESSHNILLVLAGNNYDSIQSPGATFLYLSASGGRSWERTPYPYMINLRNLIQSDDRILLFGTPMFYSTDTCHTWNKVQMVNATIGIMNCYAQHWTNKSAIYAGGIFSMIDMPVLIKSSDGGVNWENITFKVSPPFNQMDGMNSMALDISDSVLYFAMYNGTMRFIHNSNVYYPRTIISNINDGSIDQLACDPNKSGVLLEYSANYGLQLTRDYGSSWEWISGPFNKGFWCTNIIYNPDIRAFYIGFENGLWQFSYQ